MFTRRPNYNPYQLLRLVDPHIKGEHVYALQQGLISCGFSPGVADGDFGDDTEAAVLDFQSHYKLTADGKAGQLTQRAIALHLTSQTTKKYNLRVGGLKGQVGHESSYLLGNYSILYDNGTFDAGVAQENSGEFSLEEAFNPAAAIDALGQRIAKFYSIFAGVRDDRRRFGLAQAAWNAPAWAAFIAVEEGAGSDARHEASRTLSESQRSRVENYILDVTGYLV